MRCDLLVIGAGPAGSMAAKTAVKEGLNVILIDRNKNIGIPVRCAEGINKYLFRDTGIKKDKSFIDQKINGTKIYFYNEIYNLNSDQWQGYTIDRTIFDKYLANLAKKEGAKIYIETKAINSEKINKLWSVKLKTKETFSTIEAKIIIGADGFESNVGRWVKIKKRWKKSDICKCYELLLSCPNIKENDKFHISFAEEFPNGYAWIFPKKRKANVGVGVSKNANAVKALDFYINNYSNIREVLGENLKIIEKRGGCIPMSGPCDIDQIISDGVILVGDAAGMVEPITGEGIGPSMLSGIAAGEIASKCILNNKWDKKELSEYFTNWKNKKYINTTLGTSIYTLLESKSLFYEIFSKKSDKTDRKKLIKNLSNIT